jgi:hypothetical protein
MCDFYNPATGFSPSRTPLAFFFALALSGT